MEEKKTYIAEEDMNDIRLDKAISYCDEDLTRSRAEQLIAEGNVAVNDTVITKTSYKVKTGDRIDLSVPKPEETQILPEDIPLDIISLSISRRAWLSIRRPDITAEPW